MNLSAGTLLYRYIGCPTQGNFQVILVHPSGNYNAKAPWGIPKGIPDEGESLEAAARRETLEEIGIIAEDLKSLGYCDYTKSRKRVYCWTGLAQHALPKCTSWEVDGAEWFSLDEAEKRMHPDQRIFIARFRNEIGN